MKMKKINEKVEKKAVIISINKNNKYKKNKWF